MKPARSDYKLCPKCGAALDVGERCNCEKQRIEDILAAFRSVWSGLPTLDRDKIEATVTGGTILGIYPLVNVNPDESIYVTGFSILLRTLKRELVTMEIETGARDREDEVSIRFSDGYVEPEEVTVYERD